MKNVHPVSGTGIRTHDLLVVSLLPLPQDQGSRVVAIALASRNVDKFVTDNVGPLARSYIY